jgi:hypothetical protein
MGKFLSRKDCIHLRGNFQTLQAAPKGLCSGVAVALSYQISCYAFYHKHERPVIDLNIPPTKNLYMNGDRTNLNDYPELSISNLETEIIMIYWFTGKEVTKIS